MPIDMREVLRLTKAGQLGEAFAHLQGGGAAAGPSSAGPSTAGPSTADPSSSSRAASKQKQPAGGGVIDMVAPSRPGGTWTAPEPSSGERPAGQKASEDEPAGDRSSANGWAAHRAAPCPDSRDRCWTAPP